MIITNDENKSVICTGSGYIDVNDDGSLIICCFITICFIYTLPNKSQEQENGMNFAMSAIPSILSVWKSVSFHIFLWLLVIRRMCYMSE